MFTGIIQYQGQITHIEHNQSVFFTIDCPELTPHLHTGSSISHDGICLTVYKILNKTQYQLQVIPETLRKTNLGYKRIGDYINLEPSLKLQDTVDGHLVQGHIDNTGEVNFLSGQQDEWQLEINFPSELEAYIVYKGSIAINGVSLTVSQVSGSTLQVSLIEHTMNHTNLSQLQAGDKVNLEVDLIARYLRKRIPPTQ